MKELERFDESSNGVHARDTAALKQGIVEGIGPCERIRMAHCNSRALFAASGFQRNDRLAAQARRLCGTREASGILKSLQMQANRSYPVIGGHGLQHGGDVDIGLVAEGENGSKRQCALGHSKV